MLQLDRLRLEQSDFHLAADWSLPKGARAAVIGPSGSGKSTLLSLIAGFIAPSQGRLLWEGRDITGLAPSQRPLTILFQEQNLFPHMSLADNLGLGLDPNLRLDAGQKRLVEQALERVGLAGLAARRPAQISGGQAGRAALARALLRARPLLLLDEPFAALGPALKVEMLDLVAEVAQETGASVLMVTHDPNDAKRFAQSVIVVSDGQAAPPRETAEVFADPPPALKAYLGGA